MKIYKQTTLILVFNTGRYYGSKGQRCAALRLKTGVLMMDIDRGIDLFFPDHLIGDDGFTPDHLMSLYDYNRSEMMPLDALPSGYSMGYVLRELLSAAAGLI